MAEITREERARLRELEAKAFPAPWRLWRGYGISHELGCTISFDAGEDGPQTDLVIRARNSLIPLLDALDEAEAEELEARAACIGLMAERDAAIARAEKAEAKRDSFRDGIVAMLVAAGAPEDIGAMESMVSAAGKKPSDFVRQRIRVLTEELDAMRAERDALKARLAEAGDKVQEMCERIGRIHIADYATESVELCEGLDRIRAVLLDSMDMDALKAKLADLKAREAKLRDAIQCAIDWSDIPGGEFAAKYPGIESSTDLEQILRAAMAQGGGS